jgi:mono/diheme cytochrome c family protein
MKRIVGPLAVVVCLGAFATSAMAQDTPPPGANPEQVQSGASIFARNCSPCHGPRMADPEGAFDLRKFPHDQHDRFVNSVSHGKNSMPPWGGMLKPEDIEALWAYVVSGGK